MNINLPALVLGITVGVTATFVAPVAADPEIEAAARAYLEDHAQSWLGNPLIVQAINAQNAKHASIDQSGIDSLDKQWRSESESGTGPLVDEVMANELSIYLQGVREESEGLLTEVFVMDAHGLNVGQSDLTSDFWQGDEAKWQKTFSVGPDTLFVDDVELDDSSQRYQAQVSYSITDPATGKVIGAVTIGIDAEGLLML
ncbi:MAG: hypothetical protein AB8B64_03120 [Granulosicoccus sp.]